MQFPYELDSQSARSTNLLGDSFKARDKPIEANASLKGRTMDGAYLSALAALAGSSIGAFASFATTWLNQSYQQRVQRKANEMSRRERIFGEFIDEASKVYSDAMENSLTDTGKLVKLYSIKNRMKLFSGNEVTARADEVLQMIVTRYSSENVDVTHFDAEQFKHFDLLYNFTEACRKEIVRY